MELQEKEVQKGQNIQESCLERTYILKALANSRCKTIKIIGQRKAFPKQRIPDSSCMRKETVDIYILIHLGMVTEKSCNLSE